MLEYCVPYRIITTVGELTKALGGMDQDLPLRIQTKTGEGEDFGDYFEGIFFAVAKEKEEDNAMLLIEAVRPQRRMYSVYYGGKDYMTMASSYDEAFEQIRQQVRTEYHRSKTE